MLLGYVSSISHNLSNYTLSRSCIHYKSIMTFNVFYLEVQIMVYKLDDLNRKSQIFKGTQGNLTHGDHISVRYINLRH